MIQAQIANRPSLLVRALRQSAATAGVAARIITDDERPWATATFEGALHRITVEADGSPALDRWLAALPDADLPLHGQIVLDVTVEPPATIVALVMRLDD